MFVPADYPIDEPGPNVEFEDEWQTKLRDDPHEISCTAERPLITEYHILWSLSYGVPTIYFNGWKSGK